MWSSSSHLVLVVVVEHNEFTEPAIKDFHFILFTSEMKHNWIDYLIFMNLYVFLSFFRRRLILITIFTIILSKGFVFRCRKKTKKIAMSLLRKDGRNLITYIMRYCYYFAIIAELRLRERRRTDKGVRIQFWIQNSNFPCFFLFSRFEAVFSRYNIREY